MHDINPLPSLTQALQGRMSSIYLGHGVYGWGKPMDTVHIYTYHMTDSHRLTVPADSSWLAYFLDQD